MTLSDFYDILSDVRGYIYFKMVDTFRKQRGSKCAVSLFTCRHGYALPDTAKCKVIDDEVVMKLNKYDSSRYQ